jgi:glycopeptide antibiotics resistance protein
VSGTVPSEASGSEIKDQLNRHTLSMPNRFQMIQKVILEPPWKDFRWKFYYFEDIFMNLIGFIPFGFLTFTLLKSKPKSQRGASIFVIVLGFLISILIETIQVYLPSRDSQAMDVLANTFGTYLGIILFRFKPFFQTLFKALFL